MILIMAVSLYTSRVVLEKLGVEDFGIYNVVAGVVVSFSIITNTLSGAISRFITFELGKNVIETVKNVISTSINIQLLLSIIVILLCETLGIWFLNTHLNIPEYRMQAANWVFQAAMASFVLRLLIVPFEAMIVAHEDMQIYAYMGIVETFLQLGIVFLLSILPFDKLSSYSWLMVAVALVTLLVYIFYCKLKYAECSYSPHIHKKQFQEMMGFAGWNFLGTSAGILRKQGVDIVVNMFVGVTVNAARGVATQIDTAICKFTSSFTTALKPQIIKSYSIGDYNRLFYLINQGARFSFYLMLFLAIPIILEMEIILNTWLKSVPDWAIFFSQLQLSESIITVLSSTLIIGMLATGNIKKYQIVVSLIALFNFPLSLTFLYLGFPSYCTYLVAIILELACLFFRILMAHQLLSMDMSIFFKNVIVNAFLVGCVACLFPLLIHLNMEYGYLRFFIVLLTSIVSCFASVFFIGLNKTEREFLNKIIKQKIIRRK